MDWADNRAAPSRAHRAWGRNPRVGQAGTRLEWARNRAGLWEVRAVVADGCGFAVLNLMSDNPGMRWDIDATRRAIGDAPQDGAPAVRTGALDGSEGVVQAARALVERLATLVANQRW